MIQSELILPIRFYNDLFNQERFSINHKPLCEKLLNYSAKELPHFQLKKNSSMAVPVGFKMRNICTDTEQAFYKRFSESAANLHEPDALNAFGPYPTQSYSPSPSPLQIFTNDCNIFKSIKLDPDDYTPTGQPSTMVINVPNCHQRFKIVFDTFINTAVFDVRIYSGAGLIATITQAGAYTYDFTPTSGTITIQFRNFNATTEDYFEISYIQSQALDIFYYTNDVRDVDLDQFIPDLTKIELENGKEIYAFCQGINDLIIPKGEYYFFIKFQDGRNAEKEFYFSEVFNIKSVEEIQYYYRLAWRNSCDLADKVIYSEETLPCVFTNTVFLPAQYFRPEYPTVIEAEEDGSGDTTPTLQRWSKTKVLEIISPEFLTDALSAIFLHDEVSLLEPKNNSEEFQNGSYVIKKIEQDISNVYEDAYQKLLLTLLIDNSLVQTGCCISLDEYGPGFDYTAEDDCTENPYKLVITDPPSILDGLFRCEDDTIVPVKLSDIIKNVSDSHFYRLKFEDDMYQVYRKMPVITGFTEVLNPKTQILSYKIEGFILPNSFAYPEYSKNGGAYIDTLITEKSDSEGAFSAYIDKTLSTDATDFKIRVKNLTKENNYGTSDQIDII